MIHDWKMEIYWRVPVFLQEFGLSLYARQLDKLYYGGAYEAWSQRFESRRHWSRSEAESWQSQKLRWIIDLSGKRVPYYRNNWNKLAWQSVRSAADLHLLPTLGKQEIRQKEHLFLADGLHPRSLWLEKTSGTTGTPLHIYWSKAKLPEFWAIMEVMVRNVAGVARDMPRAMMGGRPIVRGSATRPPYWRFNRRWRQLYLSSYHISQATATSYAAALKEFGSQWITGYGSAIAALADCAAKGPIKRVPQRSVITSGDTLLDGMRASIEEFFECKCFDHYGQAEGVAMAMECPEGKMHIIPEVGIWEIVGEDGAPCAPGEVGEIVATGLLNHAMPLIRYRLGDWAAWAKDQSCSCGNQQAIITDLQGRVDDYLITSDGRKIGRLSTAMKRSPTIHSAQVVQDEGGHAFLLVQPGESYRPSDGQAIKDDILERIGSFDIEVVETGAIPRTATGKSALVVRLMDRPSAKETYASLFTKQRLSL
jgi:phenylacetate-CoA ligase